MYKTYQVKMGDTWDSIAEKFHTKKEVLVELNGNMILVPDTFLVVPKATRKDYFKTYTIKKGDNLYEIARKNKTTVDILLMINGLEKEDFLYPGQELLIPQDGMEMFITKDGETLFSLSKRIRVPEIKIIQDNEEIYLLPNQLIIDKK